MKNLKSINLILILFLSEMVSAQYTQYVARYNGPGNSADGAYWLLVDKQGYVYVTGRSTGIQGNLDYATIKYDHYLNLDLNWQNNPVRYNGPGNGDDYVRTMALDPTGQYLYVTGWAYVGPAPNEFDVVTIKYSTVDGQVMPGWPQRYNPFGGNDDAESIAIDIQGNIYVSGQGKVPYTNNPWNIFTIKYDPNGNILPGWPQTYDGGGNDYAWSGAVDQAGYFCLTGATQVAGDGYDIITIKYNPNGNIEPGWPQTYHGTSAGYPNVGYCLAVDRYFYVWVTGRSRDDVGGIPTEYITTIRYDGNGAQQWVAKFPSTETGGRAQGNSIAIYQTPCVGDLACWHFYAYVTGVTSTSSTGFDITTLKYDQDSPTELWPRTYNYANFDDYADDPESIATDKDGYAYVAGESYNPGTDFDYVTIKYDKNGTPIWNSPPRYDGTGLYDYSHGVATDNAGAVYVTGESGVNINEPGVAGDYATVGYLPAWGDGSSGTSSNLNAAFTCNTDTAWIAGDNGLILRSVNGGMNWTSQQSNSQQNLNDISFISRSRGITVGDGGTVLVTTNSGISWINRTINLSINLNKIHFINSNTAAAVGANGKIFRTTDGGNSWLLQSTTVLTSLNSVAFSDANNGIAVGQGGTTLRTGNGGTTWTLSSSFTSRSLNAVCMTNSQEIFAAGDSGAVYYSSNSGSSWINRSCNTTQNLRSIVFVSSCLGYAIGDGGTIFSTGNKGASWVILYANRCQEL